MDSQQQRRKFLLGMSSLAGSLGLAGCGGGESGSAVGTDSGTAAPPASAPSPVTPPVTPPAMPAPPPPAATPSPPPPPPAPGVELQAHTMDRARMIVFNGWHESSRYERYQRLTVLRGTSATISFHGEDFVAGGALRPLVATTYRLLVDSTVMASSTIVAGASRGSFTLPLGDLSQGWHVFDIAGDTAETCPRWFMYVDKGMPRIAAPVPVASGSYDVAHRATKHFVAMLPSGLKPAAWPLTPRTCPPFSEALSKTELFRENLVPSREGNINRLNRTADGVDTTFNRQAYFWSDLIKKLPPLPLLDGPRNVGTFMMPTTVFVTRQGGAYFSDAWRVGRIDPDGTISTRAGYRHRHPPSYYAGEQNLELVGDWSAIPADRRGFHEIWGMAWDMASLATDPSAAPIDNEQPHLTGPRMFVSDSQNNRVILLSFKHNTHDAPVVTEFLTDLQDPWDVVWVAGVLYVSERKAHRIAAYDARTGAFLRVVVASGSATPLATIDVNRDVKRLADLATLQAQPCVAPEGMFHQDGWLYFGAKANGQVRRVHLTTGVLEVVCSPKIDDNSKFVKIALSDGSFGPRGTVFTWTWSIGNFGMPEAFLPGGTRWGYNTFERLARGRGGKWESLGYASAGGIGLGRLLSGSSQEGLVQISRALPTDPAPDLRRYMAGQSAFVERGYNLIHGHHGYGYHGMALPWGQSEDIDYYLTWNGLARPAA